MTITAISRLTTLHEPPITALDEGGFWAAIDAPVARRVLESAVECFARQGYHGTTTRQIAQLSGLSPGGAYVHFESKTDILYAIALWGHHTSLNTVERALLDAGDERHETQLRRVVHALVTWHVDFQHLARVIAYEQDLLPEKYKATMRPFRRRFFSIVEDIISAGQDNDEFHVIARQETTRALLSMCTDVARWYRPGREPGPAMLADRYSDIAVRLVRS